MKFHHVQKKNVKKEPQKQKQKQTKKNIVLSAPQRE